MRERKIVGYTAGVYDMFHVGHLNLLKRAKEYCDYLIVGVNSDKATYSYKNKFPVIPEKERLSIIESIKYVDQAILVSETDKIFAYNTLKPDMIIVGDDHKEEAKWQELDCYLRKYGSKVVFLPYTKHISSTKLRNFNGQQIKENQLI